jgi:hypothetical protein
MKDFSAGCVDIGFKSSLVNGSKFKSRQKDNHNKEIQDAPDQGTTIHERILKIFISGLTIVVTVAGSKNTTFLLPSPCKFRIWNCHPLLQFRLLTGDIGIL